jgi:hypothetical protein
LPASFDTAVRLMFGARFERRHRRTGNGTTTLVSDIADQVPT